MKSLTIAFLVGISLMAQPAAAAPRDFRPGLQGQDQRHLRPRPDPGEREIQRERRIAPERDKRPRRLTEEERRELRRDVDRANREIYRRRFER
ncbi:MAG: hypothetical protein HY526_03275 [Betaproteobacteria bacterium]|nr:hypothetical protein [Betaproteobacteria bacterium]